MSSFSALWKRAFLWRICLLLGLSGVVLSLLFPTPWLQHILPSLPYSPALFGRESSIRHLSGISSFPPETGGQQGSSSAASSNNGPSDLSPSGSQQIGQGLADPEHDYPDLNEVIQFSTSLAGRQIPLPAGEWHPVMKARTKEHFPIAFMALVRTNHNIITGLILAETSLAPTAASPATAMTQPCHDDRNIRIERHETPLSSECIILEPALFTGLSVNSDDFINDSLARLRLSGFIMPPFMIAASWRHLQLDEQGDPSSPPTAHFMAVDTLLPPLVIPSRGKDAGPIPLTMIAPFEMWLQALTGSSNSGSSNPGTSKDPAVRYFIGRMTSWLHQWRPLLQQGYNHNLPSGPALQALINRPEMRDPMAHFP